MGKKDTTDQDSALVRQFSMSLCPPGTKYTSEATEEKAVFKEP